MKIPNVHQQMFGDINKQLNKARAQMNKEIQKKCFHCLERKRAKGGDADGS